jgi:hypothetical protein
MDDDDDRDDRRRVRMERIYRGQRQPRPGNEAEERAYREGQLKRGEVEPMNRYEREIYRLGELEREARLRAERGEQGEFSEDSVGNCMICEKVDIPLFHCAECMDSAYCSQQCQIQGCGNKHL